MKNTNALLVLVAAALISLVGCGSSEQPPPAQAVVHPLGEPPATTPKKVWTKADKIAAVNKAPISDEQKKTEIAKLNSEPGN